MAQLTIAEAVRISGRNRTTIFRAIKAGRLSVSANGKGVKGIERSELDRVFPATEARTERSTISPSAELLQVEREKSAALERQIADLQRRLDASEAERRTVAQQLTALLTDQRPARRWWRLWRR